MTVTEDFNDIRVTFSTKKGDTFGFIRGFLLVHAVVRQPDDFPRENLWNCLAQETKKNILPVEINVLPLRICRYQSVT
jgi:hypothetical protein